MGIAKEMRYHYTCDRKGCHEHGTAERIGQKNSPAPILPDGWMWISLNHPKPSTPTKLTALLCPACSESIGGMVHNRADVAPQPEEEAAHAS